MKVGKTDGSDRVMREQKSSSERIGWMHIIAEIIFQLHTFLKKGK